MKSEAKEVDARYGVFSVGCGEPEIEYCRMYIEYLKITPSHRHYRAMVVIPSEFKD